MALTPSNMLTLGTTAPDFSLPDPDGGVHSLSDFADAPALVVVFMCNHCPHVQHIKPVLATVFKGLQDRGVACVGISANDVAAYPEDGPEYMGRDARRYGYTFPYLYDETQAVARAYDAACTPDFYVFDGERRLAYRGQFCPSRPGNGIPVTGSDLIAAVDAVLAGRPVSADQKPSIGCNIKWKAA